MTTPKPLRDQDCQPPGALVPEATYVPGASGSPGRFAGDLSKED